MYIRPLFIHESVHMSMEQSSRSGRSNIIIDELSSACPHGMLILVDYGRMIGRDA
jgi:hypothetical protein